MCEEVMTLGAPAENDTRESELLASIHGGSREAMARYVLSLEPLIRRRVAGKLGARMRRVFDSQDIVATVLRRIDVYLSEHEIRATTEGELRALVMRVANTAVIDKVRLLERLRRAEDDPLALSLRTRIERGDLDDAEVDSVIGRALQSVEDSRDQRMLWLWLSGLELKSIGVILEMKPDAVRKRWQRLRESLSGELQQEITE